ncbi:apolipoprotein N-acyltransferase [Microbacterium nanhaiense]|uniref:Apolipoprotein N-acyltransferase n=1 Tax=Microbacterium nanhaiense TaxID=1301026 RepID=A0ABQ2MXM5_9MICO|nr:apolipoprotein N-acyltransferase [Microbacterium nanhaiense]GGO59706.1 apolipoprotein N-acyltransferase [Microbacterium nanhaiense]
MTRPLRPRIALPLWLATLASIAGGLAFMASFPAPGIWPLAFVAIALSLVSLIGRRPGGALLVGSAFGAAFYFPHISWTAGFLGDNELAWVPWAALASFETLLMGLGAILISLAYRWIGRIVRSPLWRMAATSVAVAGLWTSREIVLGSWPFGGFPWGRVGMGQVGSPLGQFASWVGVDGLTFAIVLAVALAVEATRLIVGRRRIRRWWTLAAPAFVLAVVILVPQFPTHAVGTLRVAAVQGNGPTAYLDERARYDVLDAQLQATDVALDAGADLIAWPEGSVGLDPRRDDKAAGVLTAVAQVTGAPILLNAAADVGDDTYNMSMLWTENGVEQTHSKRNPVPFGEYVPVRHVFEKIVPSLIGMIGREYTPGTDAPTMEVGGTTIGLAICFDVLYDSLVHESIEEGAEVLVFQTNNADFRGSDENLQQLEFARMRAIETGRTVVNVSTVGTSEVIAPDGSTLEQVGVDTAGAIVRDVELREGTTPAVWAAPWIRGILLGGPPAALAIFGVLAVRFRRSLEA